MAKTLFKGSKYGYYDNKDVMRMDDTYTFTGAKKVLTSYRNRFEGDE